MSCSPGISQSRKQLSAICRVMRPSSKVVGFTKLLPSRHCSRCAVPKMPKPYNIRSKEVRQMEALEASSASRGTLGCTIMPAPPIRTACNNSASPWNIGCPYTVASALARRGHQDPKVAACFSMVWAPYNNQQHEHDWHQTKSRKGGQTTPRSRRRKPQDVSTCRNWHLVQGSRLTTTMWKGMSAPSFTSQSCPSPCLRLPEKR